MSAAKFEFSLQPKLDQLADEKSASQLALQAAVRDRDDARAALVELQGRCDALVHELHAPGDDSQAGRARPAWELIDQGRAYEACSARIDAMRVEIDQQQKVVTSADELVFLRERELADVVATLQAIEQLRDRQKAQWLEEAAKAQQAEIDDAAISAWVRRSQGSK